ncbi:MAG TPA: DUF2933 domain-containing protein [Candidatus Limnocylindria bacterium]|nr:DUF2933 domain-containing protein [Candidatus Limnocylindria bacterium]
MRELLLLVVVLACPLAMLLMMRGRHGHDGRVSTEQLRERRDELDRLIGDRD